MKNGARKDAMIMKSTFTPQPNQGKYQRTFDNGSCNRGSDKGDSTREGGKGVGIHFFNVQIM